jgi:hypothetical protein
MFRIQLEEIGPMIKTSILAVACAGFFAASGAAFACDMHKNGHASLQTAATAPAAVPPPAAIPAPKPEPVMLPSTPAAVEAMSTEAYGGCAKRNKQTVYYTD